jgi:hypothetical protein
MPVQSVKKKSGRFLKNPEISDFTDSLEEGSFKVLLISSPHHLLDFESVGW